MRLDHLANAVVRGVLPFQPTLRRVKRWLKPYDDNPANSDFCITNGLEQLRVLKRADVAVRGMTVLEFGSGWLPLIPMLFRLAGAERLVMTDIVRLMDDRTTARARQLLAGRIADIAAVLEQPEAALLAALEQPFVADYLVPWDPEQHMPESVDIVLSRAVLEHVPEPQIRFFLAQFRRILRPDGVMCHVIDNSDHWQHKDRSLSRIDFLRYEDDALVWRLAQLNEQAFQNRLRHGDYAAMMEEAGFTLLSSEGDPDTRCLEDLATLPLSNRFRGRDPRDLAILSSTFVARRA